MAALYEVVGARQLRKTLKAAGDDLGDLKAIHLDAANIVAARTRTGAPEVSGALGATIRTSGTKTAGIVRLGNNRKVPYSGPIHWGWPARNIPANTFATDAAKETEPVWIGLYDKYVSDTLNQIEGT